MLSENAVTSIHLRRRPQEILRLEVLSSVAKEDTVVLGECKQALEATKDV